MSYLFSDAITYKDSTSLDAFARLRTSRPLVLLDSKQIFDNQPLFWDERKEPGSTGLFATYNSDRASTTIKATSGATGFFTRQTYQRYNYQAGKSMLILMTGVLGLTGGGPGIIRRAGYFDDDNGIFFEDTEGTINAVLRSSVTGAPVDQKVPQSQWNVDKFDGTGKSGITLDPSKVQIIYIDFEWLGSGRVRMGFNIDGVNHVVHEFKSSNTIDSVYMSNSNLPVRYQVVANNNNDDATLECICATVVSEGGTSDVGVLRSQGATGITITNNGNIYPIMGIRLKNDHLGAEITPVNVSVLGDGGSAIFEWFLILNPTISLNGGSFTYSDINDADVERAVGDGAVTVTGGYILETGFFSADSRSAGIGGAALVSSRKIGVAIDGTRDQLVLCAQQLSGAGNKTVYGALNWRETP